MLFEEQYPYGSARFARPFEIHKAFNTKGGVPFGFYSGRKLFHAKNAGMLLIGGAGSGKFTSILAHLMDAPGRGGDAPTLNLVIDEAAQLGRFPEIAEFYSIGRGFGLCPVCVYQDIGQIRNNLGPTGAMTLSASADIEVYLGGGISDLETARHLSAKLGNQTLELDDHLTQHRAQREMRVAMHDALFGIKGGAIRTGLAMKALDYERGHKRKQARALMTPEEILGMSHKQSLVMASGYGIPPFLSDKSPYFAMKRYSGLYGPNPYFDRDLSTVKVPGRFRSKRSLKVITEAVPSALADLPQYQNGMWSFIEGHRPNV
ncbi:TraM recognition domain-containing protein [Maribius pontilimi]|uniref:TraM recognition domain-containing protein n=1 Tax=Palleronia pontilimi TaxID=1964209 RepID=A0A934II93_9RHOB|nr:TraM recognition domain-containing protein [Palleronia pontilimi]MBJ3763855.1 TraM recognition domain-containing protein [Palleronia pontilimi]